jgi:hypothetical protein
MGRVPHHAATAASSACAAIVASAGRERVWGTRPASIPLLPWVRADRVETRYRVGLGAAILRSEGGTAMEALETYTSVLALLSAALLLVAAGLAKKQLVWKAKPVPMRRRRRRS